MTWTEEAPLVIETYSDSPPQTLTDEEIRYLIDGIETQYETQNPQSGPTNPVTLKQVPDGTKITANGYAGTIVLPSGREIELRPNMSARSFLRLVSYAAAIDPPFVSDSITMTDGDVVLNAFTARYLAELRSLLDDGLRPGYRRIERTRQRLRGHLDVQQQLQQPPVSGFVSEADELTYDTPLNRAVYHATTRLAATVDSEPARNELHEMARTLRHYVSPAPMSPAESIDPSQPAYRGITPLVSSILRDRYLGGLDPGDQRAYSLLVQPWRVFQQAVERAFSEIEQQRTGIRLETQVTVRDTPFIDGDQFEIRPDFVLHDDCTPVLVADTKWKPRENTAIYQIVTYQLVLDVPGLLLYPEESAVDQDHVVDDRHLLRLVSLPTANRTDSNELFVREMEQALEREINQLLES